MQPSPSATFTPQTCPNLPPSRTGPKKKCRRGPCFLRFLHLPRIRSARKEWRISVKSEVCNTKRTHAQPSCHAMQGCPGGVRSTRPPPQPKTLGSGPEELPGQSPSCTGVLKTQFLSFFETHPSPWFALFSSKKRKPG